MRAAAAATGLLLLSCSVLGAWHGTRFWQHMLGHLAIVAVASPLLVLTALPALDRVRGDGLFSNPLAASLFELVVVWGWHAPQLHHAARVDALAFAAEQLSFLVAGLWLWGSCLRGAGRGRGGLAGAGALLFTSMHMTLLGALLSLSPRSLYGAHAALADQQVGGVLMLTVGGAAYLVGGLALLAVMLKDPLAPGPQFDGRGN